ncbi:hypothetical protein ACJPQX_06900 [Vibrio vulnificus]|uniref:hypothetical protein n=1 Tax=Vibrio vulnificus TaxID=672 RepID=UPI001022D2EC|nr:hypothetical protein [Vibrio vulnificus]MCA0767694.1 hypothetical protein [Vibrio vulnificus]MDT9658708.1 hypothetical protein [Vibrio vulnificus]QMV38811.1 hypothetical protein F6X00_20690 [Vibrio vulnificus]RZP68961.1 hypothetical protein D8T45_02410 [Vibrio vulnificus]RZR17086.1 hypothetical protein D8T24_06980 [Vibrio vulnificus]
MRRYLSSLPLSIFAIASLLMSGVVIAQSWSVVGQITQADLPLSSAEVEQESGSYRCEQQDGEAVYCYDALNYYQQTFIGEVTVETNFVTMKLMTPFNMADWSQLQLNLRKDLMQIAEVSVSGDSFDVQAQLSKAKTQEERNLVDKSLVIFLNKYRTHSQTQRWLPASQYHLQQPSVLAEISHDSEWITLVITRFLPPTKNEK